MELYVWGKSQKEIANALELSTHTVDKTIRNAYEKLGIGSSELNEFYMIRHLGVSENKNPLRLYDFSPRLTAMAVARKVAKYSTVVLLMLGATDQIVGGFMNPDNRMLRTVRGVRSGRTGRRADTDMLDLFNDLIPEAL